jgi:hypothetical protein
MASLVNSFEGLPDFPKPFFDGGGLVLVLDKRQRSCATPPVRVERGQTTYRRVDILRTSFVNVSASGVLHVLENQQAGVRLFIVFRGVAGWRVDPRLMAAVGIERDLALIEAIFSSGLTHGFTVRRKFDEDLPGS